MKCEGHEKGGHENWGERRQPTHSLNGTGSCHMVIEPLLVATAMTVTLPPACSDTSWGSHAAAVMALAAAASTSCVKDGGGFSTESSVSIASLT